MTGKRKDSAEPVWSCVLKAASTFAPEPPPPPVNRMMDRCRGCPYPRHGIICWHADGSCLRTDMEQVRKEPYEQK